MSMEFFTPMMAMMRAAAGRSIFFAMSFCVGVDMPGARVARAI
ncbi:MULTISPECIES: hypothetical protein [unclassified Undibacterium]